MCLFHAVLWRVLCHLLRMTHPIRDSHGNSHNVASVPAPSYSVGTTAVTNQRSPSMYLLGESSSVPGIRGGASASEDRHGGSAAASNNEKVVTKDLLCIRHGISTANEYMRRHKWGSPSFRDDPSLIDAPLSKAGLLATERELPGQLLHQPDLLEFLVGNDNGDGDARSEAAAAAAAATTTTTRETLHQHNVRETGGGVELVVVSPLTRCLQTYVHGVEPVLRELLLEAAAGAPSTTQRLPVPVVALPLLRERVYTASDTGRPIHALRDEFPTVDFSACPNDDRWWYHARDIDDTAPEADNEWRPHGQGQWYAVPGEPSEVFERRMAELEAWLARRPETRILVVAHWAVLKHLGGSSGVEWKNAEAKRIDLVVRSGTPPPPPS